MKRFNTLLLLVAAIVMASSVQSYAASAAIGFDWTGDGNYDLVVTDNLAGDLSPLLGQIIYAGALGPNFNINVTTGLTKPQIGSTATFPKLDLNSVDVSGGNGRLLIDFFDTGFNYSGILKAGVGGTTTGSAAFSVLKNGSCPPILNLGTFNTNPFAGAGTTNVTLSPLDQITLEAIITHGPGFNTTSFNLDTHAAVPIPAVAWLLGSGIVGLLGIRRRIGA